MTEIEQMGKAGVRIDLLLHERQALLLATAGMLSGAVASCIDVLERPTENAVLAVFTEACRRAHGPDEVPIRLAHRF